MPILALGRSIAKPILLRCRILNTSGQQCGVLAVPHEHCTELSRRALPRGFTLIEVMVTMLIASVVFGMAILSLRSLDRTLQIEAQRVAQLLSFARDYAQMRGRAVRFEADEQGYRFISRTQGDWALILDEPLLRERAWDKPTRVRLERYGANAYDGASKLLAGTGAGVAATPGTASTTSDAAIAERTLAGQENMIEFGRDYVDSPFLVWLSQSDQKVAIAGNGLGKFSVQMEATQ
jgi:type II secretion system protein H